MKAGLAGLIEQRKIGTEIFVTIATLVAVFDKTGTLTANSPRVVQISAIGSSFDDTALLRLAAAANRRSSHPLAKAVVAEALLRNIVVPEPDSFEQLQGRGVKAGVDGHTVLVGNAALLRDNGVTMEAPSRMVVVRRCTSRLMVASSVSS